MKLDMFFCTVLLACEWERDGRMCGWEQKIAFINLLIFIQKTLLLPFFTIGLSQLSNTKLECREPVKAASFGTLIFLFTRQSSPIHLNCLQMVLWRRFQNDLLKYDIDFLSQCHKRTLSYLRNNLGLLLSSHSPALGTYFLFALMLRDAPPKLKNVMWHLWSNAKKKFVCT